MATPSFSAESALYRTTHNYRSTARLHRSGDTIAPDSNILIPASHCTCPCCLEYTCGDAGTCLVCCDADGNIVQ
jgi:hypothetical protein